MAKFSLQAEEKVKASGVPYNIVRPAIVYGPGDLSGITPRLIIGAVYQKIGESMEFLWEKGLRICTVHVEDVACGLATIATKAPAGEVYNLADSADSDQGSIGKLIATLFGIKVDYFGSIKSSIATTVSMKTVADVANDKHLKPWSDLLKLQGIPDSPLTPYLDEELLYNNSLSLNGKKVTGLDFTYKYPEPTLDLLRAVVLDFEAKKFFPAGLLKA